MKKIAEGIHTWSIFDEERKLDFNGLYLKTPGRPILIDPPPMKEADRIIVEKMGKPHKIYLTNKHHTRDSETFRKLWGCQILVHEDDQPLMEIKVDGTFSDGELLEDELEAIRIPNAKTPGECAFYWKSRGVLIVGDAVIGKPEGLGMLADEKFKDPKAARQGLLALRGLDFNTFLVGDGKSILENARPVVEKFIDSVI